MLACPRRCSQYLSLEFDIFLQSVFHLGQEQREYKRWDFDNNETFQKRHLTGGGSGMRLSRAELLESWNFETEANMQTLKSLPASLLSYRIGFQQFPKSLCMTHRLCDIPCPHICVLKDDKGWTCTLPYLQQQSGVNTQRIDL